MIQVVDRAMVACQAALFARELYGGDHPAVGAALQRARAALGEALADKPSLTVMLVEGRVVCEGNALPTTAGLGAGLFKRLSGLGIEWVRFERGTGVRELGALIEAIERAALAPDEWAGRTIHIGFIQGADETTAAGAGPVDPRLSAAASPAAVERLWKGIGEEGRVDNEVLSAVIADISAASAPSAGMFIRLAALKSHDEYTFVHTVNVAILSAALARSVGLPAGDVHAVITGALLHDIGKTLVPPQVLNKPEMLTDEERAAVRRHPVEGAVLLLNTKDVPPVAPIVAFEHHIRPDGGGYPAVPAGWRTTLATRIVQIADVFDALRTRRPYRPAMPMEEAALVLRRGAGTTQDADLTEEFLAKVAFGTERDAPAGQAGVRAAA